MTGFRAFLSLFFLSCFSLPAASPPFSAKPLIDYGVGQLYLGRYPGMLYEVGNNPPADHAAAGALAAASVVPLDATGNPDPAGKIVLLSLGLSCASEEWCQGPPYYDPNATSVCVSNSFIGQTAANPLVNHTTLTILNGAQNTRTVGAWVCANGDCYDPRRNLTFPNQFDRVRDTVLVPAGVAEPQVQAVWLKEADVIHGYPTLASTSGIPEAITFETLLGQVIRAVHIRWPNVRLIFLSSRIYAGYAASTAISPEPYAYEYGFSLKWLIQAQVQQRRSGLVDPVAGDLLTNGLPVVMWGPYLWGNGTNNPAGSTALSWVKTDYHTDYVHPAATGVAKVVTRLMDFFLNSPYTVGWFSALP